MNLDFLDVLSQPIPNHREQVGTAGTASVHAGCTVPTAIPDCGNSGNKIVKTEDSSPVPIADNAKCSHVFLVCSQPAGTGLTNVYAVVPNVPGVPSKISMPAPEAGSDHPPDTADAWREDFARWLDSACVCLPRCFGGVSRLHRAFCKWEVQRGGAPSTRDTFEKLLTERGFLIGEVAGHALVSGLIFREDLEVYR